jgi:Ca2+-binding EF-hand superfamily protein
MSFIKLPCITMSPINDFIVTSFDKELKGKRITYNEFLSYLSILHKLCPSEFKNQFIFQLMDQKEKGYLDKSDVLGLVSRIIGIHQEEDKAESQAKLDRTNNFVNQIFLTFDPTQSGKLTRDMFNKALGEKEVARIVKLVSLDFDWPEELDHDDEPKGK